MTVTEGLVVSPRLEQKGPVDSWALWPHPPFLFPHLPAQPGREIKGSAPFPVTQPHLSCFPAGEPRGAALVSLLQPLRQLHHREYHQSSQPQSHGHRGHVRCCGSSRRDGQGVQGTSCERTVTLDREDGSGLGPQLRPLPIPAPLTRDTRTLWAHSGSVSSWQPGLPESEREATLW